MTINSHQQFELVFVEHIAIGPMDELCEREFAGRYFLCSLSSAALVRARYGRHCGSTMSSFHFAEMQPHRVLSAEPVSVCT